MAKSPRGKDTLTTRIAMDGVEEIKKDFEEIGKAGEDALQKISKSGDGKKIFDGVSQAQQTVSQAFNKLRTDVGATLQGIRQSFASLRDPANQLKAGLDFQDAISKTSSAFSKLNQSFEGTRRGLALAKSGVDDLARGAQNAAKAFGVLSLAVGGVVAVTVKLATNAADSAEQIQNQANAFGLSFEQAQKLRNAINEVGGDESLFERALTRFTSKVGEAGDGSEQAADKIQKLRDQWKDEANSAGSFQKRMEIDAKFREKLADATEKASKAQSQFANVQAAGFEGLVQYANSVTKLGSSQEQLARVTQDFGARGAVTLLAFLRNISDAFDDSAAASLKLLPALDQLGQTRLADLDQAGDRLNTNFSRLSLLVGSQLAPAFTAAFDQIREIIGEFGPAIANAVGSVATSVARVITDNKAAIKEFASAATSAIIKLARDINEALSGVSSGDTSNWIIRFKDQAVQTFEAIRFAVQNVLIPAFNGLGTALTPLAGLINALFGTEFTGKTLAAAVVITKLTGTFGLLSGAVKLLFSPFRIFFSLLINGKAIMADLRLALVTLIPLLRTAVIGIAAVVAANPLLIAVGVAIGGIAAALVLYSGRQSEAEQAVQLHADAMQRLKDIQAEIDAQMPGSIDKLEQWKNEQLAAAQAGLISAKAGLAAAAQRRDELVITLGMQKEGTREWNLYNRAVQDANKEVNRQSDLLHQIERDLAQAMLGYEGAKDKAKELTEENKKLAASADKAANSVNGVKEGFAEIKVSSGSLGEKVFQVPTEKFLQAQKAARELTETLKGTGEGSSSALDTAALRNEAFVNAAKEAATQYQAAIDQMTAASEQLRTSAEAIFAGIGTGAATMAQGWGTQLGNMALQVKVFADQAQAALTQVNAAVDQLAPQGAAGGAGLPAAAAPGTPGADQTKAAQDAVLAWQQASAQVQQSVEAMELAIQTQFQTLATGLSQALATLPASVNSTAVSVETIFGAMATRVSGLWLQVIQDLDSTSNQFASSWASVMSSIQSSTSAATSTVSSLIAGLRSELSRLESAIGSAQDKAASGSSGSGSTFAYGGMVRGFGGPTQDNIDARVSVGEYIFRSAAVRRLPLQFLNMLNSARYSFRDILSMWQPRRYAMGGLVMPQATMPSFAGIGLGSSGGSAANVTIQIDGRSYGPFSGPYDAIMELDRANRSRAVRSTGRPNPYDRS